MDSSACWCVCVNGSLILERLPGVGDEEAYAITDRTTGKVLHWLCSRNAARGWLRRYPRWSDQKIETELHFGDQWAKMQLSMTSLRRSAAAVK